MAIRRGQILIIGAEVTALKLREVSPYDIGKGSNFWKWSV
jgi:hypothetical protein